MRHHAVIVAMVLTVTSSAWTKEIYESYELLFIAAEKSGKPVLIVYMAETTCGISNGNRDYMLKSRKTVQTVHPHFEVAEIPITNGDKYYSQYRKRFSGCYFPFWVVAAPDETFIDGGDSDSIKKGPKDNWRQRVGKIAAKHPPITPKDRARAAELLKEAKQAIRQQQYAPAARNAKRVKKAIWYPKETAGQCQEILDQIKSRGEQALDAADALAKNHKLLEAALAYDEIVTKFSEELPAGKTADAKLKQLLLKHRDVAKQYSQSKRADRAAKLLAGAKLMEKEGKLLKAARAYLAVIQRYKDTPSADQAKIALDRINPKRRTSPAAASPGADDEKKAASLVKLARSYRAAGRSNMAGEKLIACIKKYPDTKAAKQAAELMAEWKLSRPTK